MAQSIAVTILDDEGDKATLSVTTDRATTIEGETFPITLTASVAPADDLTVAFTIERPRHHDRRLHADRHHRHVIDR